MPPVHGAALVGTKLANAVLLSQDDFDSEEVSNAGTPHHSPLQQRATSEGHAQPDNATGSAPTNDPPQPASEKDDSGTLPLNPS